MNSDSASPRRFRQRSNSESACARSSVVEIRAPEIEVADPGVEQLVGLLQELIARRGITSLQGDPALDDLRVGLRLGLELGRQRLACLRALLVSPVSTNVRAARKRIGTARLRISA